MNHRYVNRYMVLVHIHLKTRIEHTENYHLDISRLFILYSSHYSSIFRPRHPFSLVICHSHVRPLLEVRRVGYGSMWPSGCSCLRHTASPPGKVSLGRFGAKTGERVKDLWMLLVCCMVLVCDLSLSDSSFATAWLGWSLLLALNIVLLSLVDPHCLSVWHHVAPCATDCSKVLPPLCLLARRTAAATHYVDGCALFIGSIASRK